MGFSLERIANLECEDAPSLEELSTFLQTELYPTLQIAAATSELESSEWGGLTVRDLSVFMAEIAGPIASGDFTYWYLAMVKATLILRFRDDPNYQAEALIDELGQIDFPNLNGLREPIMNLALFDVIARPRIMEMLRLDRQKRSDAFRFLFGVRVAV